MSGGVKWGERASICGQPSNSILVDSVNLTVNLKLFSLKYDFRIEYSKFTDSHRRSHVKLVT